jgi:Tfp pilus assembly protein PilW
VLISAGISSVILAGVLSTFVMMGRTGANAQNYTELEAEARKALELFSREVRLAYAVTAYSTTSVTLSISDNTSSRTGTGTGAYSVTYTFDTGSNSFTRTGPPASNPAGASSTTTLISNVLQITGVNPFNYYRFVTSGGYQTGFTTNTAANTTEIKQIELNFVAQRKNNTVAAATDKVLSARYILRNK